MALDQNGLDLLFQNARTFSHWLDKPVDDDILHKLFEELRMAPTSANCSPGRFVFVRSTESKAKLKPCLDEGNVAQSMAAPVTAIVATDFEFYEHLPHLYPHADARSWFAGMPDKIHDGGFRNGTLQGAYLILAARAFGLDCGPMSGFDNAAVDETFLAGTPWKSNFLVNLGHGDTGRLHPRGSRLDFNQACRIV
jgi:3-hydroxypropanoate dehydrogenase